MRAITVATSEAGSADLSPLHLTVPARRGLALELAKGSTVAVVNTHGHQVVDTWAFSAEDTAEYMSMEHSRVAIRKLSPAVGDTLVTNRRRPIVTVTDDTTPGVHDTLIAACDTYRYVELGGEADHDNCTHNLAAAMAAIGRSAPCTPCPLNLFMNVSFEGGQIAFLAPTSAAGQSVSLRAEIDLILVFSACPQDLTAVNGHDPSCIDLIVTGSATPARPLSILHSQPAPAA